MTLHYLVKTAATANYHSTSGRSWKTTKPIQKGMKEVMMGIITLLTSIIWFIFLLADLINLSSGITTIVVKICDTPPIVQVRGCLNSGSRAF